MANYRVTGEGESTTDWQQATPLHHPSLKHFPGLGELSDDTLASTVGDLNPPTELSHISLRSVVERPDFSDLTDGQMLAIDAAGRLIEAGDFEDGVSLANTALRGTVAQEI